MMKNSFVKKSKTTISNTLATKAFSALAQETRLKIIDILANEGKNGLCPCHLVEKLDISNANLSFHLKELENAGLISKKRAGKYNHYKVNDELLDILSKLLAKYSNIYKKAKGKYTC